MAPTLAHASGAGANLEASGFRVSGQSNPFPGQHLEFEMFRRKRGIKAEILDAGAGYR